MRYTQGEKSMAIARYTLAVDRRRKEGKGPGTNKRLILSIVVAFDRAAEFAETYFHQGIAGGWYPAGFKQGVM